MDRKRRKKKPKKIDYTLDPENKQSRYGKTVYFNKILLVSAFIITAVFDLFVPLYSDGTLGFEGLTQWGMVVLLYAGLKWILAPDLECKILLIVGLMTGWYLTFIIAHLVFPVSKPSLIFSILTGILNLVCIMIYTHVDNTVYVTAIPEESIS